MYLSYDRVLHCETVSLIFVSRRANGNLFVSNFAKKEKGKVVVNSCKLTATFGSVQTTVVNYMISNPSLWPMKDSNKQCVLPENSAIEN